MSVIKIQLIFQKRFDFDIANVPCDNYLFLTVTFNCILWFAFENQIYSCALVKRSYETNSKATRSRVFNAYVTLKRQATNNPEKMRSLSRKRRKNK